MTDMVACMSERERWDAARQICADLRAGNPLTREQVAISTLLHASSDGSNEPIVSTIQACLRDLEDAGRPAEDEPSEAESDDESDDAKEEDAKSMREHLADAEANLKLAMGFLDEIADVDGVAENVYMNTANALMASFESIKTLSKRADLPRAMPRTPPRTPPR